MIGPTSIASPVTVYGALNVLQPAFPVSWPFSNESSGVTAAGTVYDWPSGET